jgi:hypothetical protein
VGEGRRKLKGDEPSATAGLKMEDVVMQGVEGKGSFVEIFHPL